MTCSCEKSPHGFSWLQPEQSPGKQEHFPLFASRSLDFDLFSSVFLLPVRGHVPVCQTSYKDFPVCRIEEEAVGLFLSVLL